MRWTHLSSTMVALATVAAMLFAAPPAEGDETARTGTPTETLATRQTVFTIPFVTAASTPGEPSQLVVHLYVSDDLGQSWVHYQTAEPAQRRFNFRAARDGTYWFATRTVPRGTPPEQITEAVPELRVAVDTSQPVLSLAAEIGSADEVRLSWRVEDENLDVDSFALTYHSGENDWRTIAVDPSRQQTGPGGMTGSAAFWPQPPGATIEVRAEVRDRAGNVAIANRRLRMPRAVAGRPVTPTPSAPAYRPPAEDAPSVADTDAGQRWPAQGGSGASTPVAPITPAYADGIGSHSRPVSESQSSTSESSDGLGWRSPSIGQQPPVQQPSYTPPPQTPVQQPQTPASGPTQLRPQPGISPQVSPEDRTAQLPYRDPFQGVVSPVQRPVGDRVDLSPAAPSPVAPEGSLVTSARQLNLAYDIEGIDPARLARVELWGSSDGGRSWVKWGEDPDRTSPMPLNVQREGVFGFRIVIVAQGGLAGQTPQPGDAPEITLTIDWTAPQAELTGAQYGQGEAQGQLVITWQANDANLAERPIRLLSANTPGGPWQPIADDLPHTGSYIWQPSGDASREIYLRLEVRDHAGNTGWHELPQPIALSGLLPRATIRAVQPLVGE